MLNSETESFSLGSCFMVVDELCPGKCKGKSHPTMASVPGMVVGLLEQRLNTTCSQGVTSLVVMALERRGVLRKANLTIWYPYTCIRVQPAGGLRQGEGWNQRRRRLVFRSCEEGKHVGRDIWKADLTEGLGETTLAPTRLGA